jgi:TRAP-type C4-dicarboxylate transport system substrate-binding protein
MKEYAPRYRKMSEEGDQDARRNLVANKVNLVEPTAEDRKHAQAIMRPMWDAWAKSHGKVGQQLVDGALKACGAS